MDENDKKKEDAYYLPIFIGLGLTFGIIFDSLALGLCFGVAIGLLFDNKKNKIN